MKVNSSLAYDKWLTIISKLANITEVDFVGDKVAGAAGFMVEMMSFCTLNETIDVDAERLRL
ncbi:hypothetical protein CS542_09670 [Pedobacter sp. IW39]|nr:hypothetical protein CS542_09670 [Pedobacter sp. IW39]